MSVLTMVIVPPDGSPLTRLRMLVMACGGGGEGFGAVVASHVTLPTKHMSHMTPPPSPHLQQQRSRAPPVAHEPGEPGQHQQRAENDDGDDPHVLGDPGLVHQNARVGGHHEDVGDVDQVQRVALEGGGGTTDILGRTRG